MFIYTHMFIYIPAAPSGGVCGSWKEDIDYLGGDMVNGGEVYQIESIGCVSVPYGCVYV